MLDTMLFGVWPYVGLAVFVVGHIWRWRADQFGWTTRTSELSERRILQWASPTFHEGVPLVIVGHSVRLLAPPSATTAMGIPESAYHAAAAGLGVVAGLVLLVGVVGLVLRRFVLHTRIRLVTRPGDVVMYAVLVVQMVLGLWQTLGYTVVSSGFDYRDSVSIWFRSIFYLHPDTALMGSAPLVFQLHASGAFAFFAVWPFSRLVHVWSAPLGYLTRPPIVYRHVGA
jgi:nitrate reductase gamma subunit